MGNWKIENLVLALLEGISFVLELVQPLFTFSVLNLENGQSIFKFIWRLFQRFTMPFSHGPSNLFGTKSI